MSDHSGEEANNSIIIQENNQTSTFLQDVHPHQRRFVLAEHEKFVRTQKMKNEMTVPSLPNNFSSTDDVDEDSDGFVANDDSSGSALDLEMTTVGVKRTKMNSNNATAHAIFTSQRYSFVESGGNSSDPMLAAIAPHVLRLSIYEKYLCLSTAFFNIHDSAISLRHLFQISYCPDIVQYHRIWVPIPTPNGKYFPHLANCIKDEGYEKCLSTFHDLFTTYPDSVTEYSDVRIYPTRRGVKAVAKIIFTGHAVKSKEQETFPCLSEIPDDLNSDGYATIFFDENNRIYEIWNDSIIPLPSRTFGGQSPSPNTPTFGTTMIDAASITEPADNDN
jgi:hypothetical protein